MDLYGERKNAIRTVLFLCAIWLVFFIADLVKQDIFSSNNENLALAARPNISKERVLSGEFMRDYERYVNDQFVARDNWIILKTGMDILTQKKVINGVYLAKDEYLVEQHTRQMFSQDRIGKSLEALQNLVAVFPQTKVMLVPTADNILADKLPAFAPYYDQNKLLQQVENAVGAERMIPVAGVLAEHAGEEIYYRTDHHWTTLGAYYAYREFVEAYDLPLRNYLRMDSETVTEEFLGTLHSKLNISREPEKIQMFPQTLEKEYTITYDMDKVTHSFYEESYLVGKDKYGYFLDGNHGLVEIERESFSNRTLFVIKDSYANSMIPLLAHHYKRIYVVDLRYFNGKLFEFMKSCENSQNMDVLVLYNCVSFVEDFQYQ